MADAIQPVPASEAPTVPITAVAVFDEQPKKKRHPVRTLIIVLVVLAVLVAAFFIADAVARSYATNYVRDRIIETLKIDPSTEVDVSLGSGSVLLQAASGSINEVNVDVPSVTFGDITGAAHLTATHVPLDSAKPVDGLTIAVTVSQDNVRKLSKFLSGVDLKSIDLTDGVIRVSAEFAVLFVTVPVTLDLAPSASSGGITFDPKTVVVSGNQVAIQDLRNNPLVSAVAGDLLKSQTFCVASYLPKALTVSDVKVVDTDLVVTITGDGVALSDPNLSELGTCP